MMGTNSRPFEESGRASVEPCGGCHREFRGSKGYKSESRKDEIERGQESPTIEKSVPGGALGSFLGIVPVHGLASGPGFLR